MTEDEYVTVDEWLEAFKLMGVDQLRLVLQHGYDIGLSGEHPKMMAIRDLICEKEENNNV